jgi:hypothetical protein
LRTKEKLRPVQLVYLPGSYGSYSFLASGKVDCPNCTGIKITVSKKEEACRSFPFAALLYISPEIKLSELQSSSR